jgi:hypothetical protein
MNDLIAIFACLSTQAEGIIFLLLSELLLSKLSSTLQDKTVYLIRCSQSETF